jgi:hypothetical protein
MEKIKLASRIARIAEMISTALAGIGVFLLFFVCACVDGTPFFTLLIGLGVDVLLFGAAYLIRQMSLYYKHRAVMEARKAKAKEKRNEIVFNGEYTKISSVA